MKKLLLLLSIVGTSVVVNAQHGHHGHHGHHLHHSLHPKMHLHQKNYLNHLRFTAGTGTATYFGDLCQGTNCAVFRPQLNVGLYYRFHTNFSARAELSYIRLAGDDAGSRNYVRNLSFASNNFELAAVLTYDFFKYDPLFFKRKDFTPYVSAGIGMLMFNPMAKDKNGEWHSLRPLKTEGVDYGKMTVVVPFTFGVRIKASHKVDICTEISYRKTFTDYLDDVSTNYVDDSKFTNRKAAELAERMGELRADKQVSGPQSEVKGLDAKGKKIYALNAEGERYINPGSLRGDSKVKDSYATFTIRCEYTIKVMKQTGNSINRVYSPKFKTRKR